MSSGLPECRRVAMVAGTAHYSSATLPDREKLPEAIRAVADSLSGLGYQLAPAPSECAGGVLLDPDNTALLMAAKRAASAGDPVVVFYTGHGVKPSGEDFYLCTANSDEEVSYTTTAVTPRQLILELLVKAHDAKGNLRPLPPDEQPAVLVIIDACMSGWVGADVIRAGLESVGNQNVWIMASTDKVTLAGESLFATALAEALTCPAVGPSQPLLNLDDIVGQINAALGWGSDQEARWWNPARGSTGAPVFFPNPRFRPELAGLTVDDQKHWLSRAEAGPEGGAVSGFYLAGRIGAGRVQAAEDLSDWMTDPTQCGMAVVTGGPGTGKSTLLALPVLLTGSPDTRSELLAAASNSSPMVDAVASRLPADLPAVAVHARGLTNDQVARRIGTALGLAAADASELLDRLRHVPDLEGRVLIVDAIDEAVTPQVLLFGLLNPVAAHLGLKTVIGARRHVLGAAGPVDKTIDLDTPRYQDGQALIDYISALLTAEHEPGLGTCYQDGPANTVATVAAALAEQATSPQPDHGQGASFLLGRLLAVAVRGRAKPVDTTDPDWLGHLPSAVADAFEEDLSRRLGEESGVGRSLLAALAWARGAGLPRTTLWIPVARALAPLLGVKPEQIGDPAASVLLDQAGAYIIESRGAGDRSVYRPFHDLLARHLRGEPTEQQALDDHGADPAWREMQLRVEQAITTALLETVPKDQDGARDWTQAHPYLRDHLSQHAYAAGPEAFTALVSDIDFLATASPSTLTPLLTPFNPELRAVAHPYRRARPLLSDDPEDNATYLDEAWLALNGRFPHHQLHPTFQPLMAWVGRDDSLLTLTPDVKTTFGLGFAVGHDGRVVVVFGTDHGVQVWDAITGERLVGSPGLNEDLQGNADERWITTLALGTSLSGGPLLAVGSHGPVARVWGLPRTTSADDSSIAPDTSITAVASETRIDLSKEGKELYAVDAVAVGTLADGRALLVTLADHEVRRWDADTGKSVGKPLDTYANCVAVASCADDAAAGNSVKADASCVGVGGCADGRMLLATGTVHGLVRFWDAATGQRVGEPVTTAHPEGVEKIALGSCEHGRMLLATTGADRDVRLWGCGFDESGHSLRVESQGVSSLAFGRSAAGRPLLATGHIEGVICVWDCVTGGLVGNRFLMGHSGPVFSLVFGKDNEGRPLLASGGADGTIRLWDPKPADPIPDSSPIDQSPGLVTALAFGRDSAGRAILATGGQDGTVRLWEPTTGKPHRDPIPLHHGAVFGLDFGDGPEGQPIIASASSDGTVRLWDLNKGAEIEDPFVNHGETVWTLACGADGDGTPLIAWPGKNGVQLWTPRLCRTLPVTGVLTLAFGVLPTGQPLLAVSGGGGALQLWDASEGTRFGDPLPGHHESLFGVAFGADLHGHLWLASCGDGVRLWDPVNRQGRLLQGSGNAYAVAFTRCTHGHTLLVSAGHDDKAVRLWDVPTGDLLGTIRRRANRSRASTQIAVAGDGLSALVAIADSDGVTVFRIQDSCLGLHD